LSASLIPFREMNSLSQITALFAQLASHLQTGPSSTNPPNPLFSSISSLNQSLNLNEDQSRVTVLNKVLSLMCFKAPEVYDNQIKCLVETIVTVLSSSISCEVLSFQNEEFLRIGSSISSRSCVKLIQTFLNISAALEGYDTLKMLLLSAVLQVAVSASCYQGSFPFTPVLNLEPRCWKITSGADLQYFFHEGVSVNNHEIPLRLLLWYLDPLTLKHDISNILQEYVERPFIDLKKELHDRISWHSIVVCLVLSPIMFIETRALLHNWFLITGWAFILELQIKLVSSMLDVLVQPLQWSISIEVGSKLPFSDAYFPHGHHLINALWGPISGERFLHLVNSITGLVFLPEKITCPMVKGDSTWEKMIDHKSTWAALMAFPEWFFFASVLLFSKKDCQSIFWATCISGTVKIEETHDTEQFSIAAARYLAYSIIPISKAHSDMLVKSLIQISESWSVNVCSTHERNPTSCGKKNIRKPRPRDNKNDTMFGKVKDGQALRHWLKDFHDCHTRYWTDSVNNCISKGGRVPNSYILHKNLLFRKIPLGILIGCTNLDEEESTMLLHYAATGEILQLTEAQNVESTHVVKKPKSTEDDLAGACLVFDLFDAVENMSASIFNSDESRLNFLSHLKVKAVKFMVKCIRSLLQVTIDEDGCKMLTLLDLHKRLEEWSYRGEDKIQSFKPLKDVIGALNLKLHSQPKVYERGMETADYCQSFCCCLTADLELSKGRVESWPAMHNRFQHPETLKTIAIQGVPQFSTMGMGDYALFLGLVLPSRSVKASEFSACYCLPGCLYFCYANYNYPLIHGPFDIGISNVERHETQPLNECG
ncbi:acyl-CoA synthetase family protein, partial [Thalictrum thalictroides]